MDYHTSLLKSAGDALDALLMYERDAPTANAKDGPTPDDAAAQIKKYEELKRAKTLMFVAPFVPGYKNDMNYDEVKNRKKDEGGHKSLDEHLDFLTSNGEMNFEKRSRAGQHKAAAARLRGGGQGHTAKAMPRRAEAAGAAGPAPHAHVGRG